jgi:hypothetical protein
VKKVPGFGDLIREAYGEPVGQEQEFTLSQIAIAYVARDWDALTEASLGRIHQHFKKSGQKSFAVVTSWRSAKPAHENTAAFNDLQRTVRSQGYGYNKMHGVGEEEGGVQSKEPSLFVHGMSLKHAVEHGKKHDQHSIIYSGPETGGRVHLVHLKDDGDKKVGDHTDLGTFHPKKIGQYYSKIRGKAFTFAESKNCQSDHDHTQFLCLFNEEIKGWMYEGDNVGEAETLSVMIEEAKHKDECPECKVGGGYPGRGELADHAAGKHSVKPQKKQ